MFATLTDDRVRSAIAAEMLRVCCPNGYLLLIDWRMQIYWSREHKALKR
jgi:hypothetical protein